MAPPSDKLVHVAHLFVPEIKSLLSERKFREIKNLVKTISCIDLAEIWLSFSLEEKLILLGLMTERDTYTLYEELEAPEQKEILDALSQQILSPEKLKISHEEFSKLFHFPSEKTLKSLTRLQERKTKERQEDPTSYPEQTIGYWMHTQKVELRPNITSSQALEKIRTSTHLRKGGGPDGYYVTDSSLRVVGYIPLRELIAAPSKTKLAEFMHPARLLRLTPNQDQEDAVQLFTKYKLSMAPVVDATDKLLGTIHAEDIIPIVQKESTEDIQKLGAVEALDEPYFKISFSKMIKKRAGWLGVLFIGELFTATAMGGFEHQIAKAVVLALFIPLIISSGGNSGSQAATLIVRALALKEVTFQDWWRVMRREFASGLALGLILGSLGFIRIFGWGYISQWIWGTNIYGEHFILVASTVGLALILVVMWGSLTGSILPIFLRRLGLDPAVVSAPFVATLVDVTGLIIYFATAMIILKGTLL